ncbi:glycosyltransferase [Actinoplanes sp. NPDC023801]|uniref:glycosyltransferase n=1 Tax=Actinoplanes sp. NPDC023801 TaxID=3154595 RepID=UPI003410C66A
MSVVIPAESTGHLPLMFAGLPAVDEVIVVVGPDEDTVLPLPRPARVIRQTRYGIGNAVACGVAAATKDVVVTLPGDGSADPATLPRYVEALRAGADVAEGCRPARRTDLILLWFMSVLLGCRPSGPGSGLRAFRRDRAGRLGLPRVAGTDPARGDGRDGEPLLAVRSRAAGLRVTEIPVAAHAGFGGTPLVTAMYAVAREYLARRRKTRTPSAGSIVVLTGGASRPAPAPILTGPIDAGAVVPGPVNAGSVVPGPLNAGAVLPGPVNAGSVLAGPVNAPRRPIASPAQNPDRWPAPNPATAARPALPNSTGLGFPDRRGSERRGPERQRTDITLDRRGAAGRPIPYRPAAEALNRRRWRDGRPEVDLNRPRTQGRPNLRVINGEGGGSGGGRGHLRSV